MASLMMEAELRTGFGKGPNRQLRRAGKIPAILYGSGKDAVPLAVDPKSVISIIRSHGGVNTIFELGISGQKTKENVMIREFQIEPVDHAMLHADFVRVAMDKEMTLMVAIELEGIAEGVKTGGGTLDFITRSVEISCFPKDIPETIVVNVEALEIGDYIRSASLQLPDGVSLVSDDNVVVVHVLEPKVEEVEEPEEGAEGAVEGAEDAGASKDDSSEEGPAKD